jgi:hypothetical protein
VNLVEVVSLTRVVRTKAIHLGFVAAIESLLASGCVIFTPPVERRISKNQENFDSYPLAIREKLRLGQIDLGYKQEMVGIALGHPDKSYRRRDAKGETIIWVYLDETVRRRHHWNVGVDLPAFNSAGGRILRRELLDLELDEYHQEIRHRVEFVDDEVSAWEQLDP